jgi:hypothetical protein
MKGRKASGILCRLIFFLVVLFQYPLLSQQDVEFLPDVIEIMTDNNPEIKEKLDQVLPAFTIQKRFPKALKPRLTFNSRGERNADISGLYTIRFYETQDILKLIEKLSKIKGIKYAEPHYLPRLCYVPSDDSVSQQYALNRIQAFAGWDLHRGDSSVVIGITDTGVEIFHPDIYPSIAVNYNDWPDGIDNDNDGYIDNYYGWDSGDNDGDPSTSGSPHGQHISGISSAASDNNEGIAGSGFNCRFIPIKIMNAAGLLSGAYEGLVYAVEMGCKIINCSWGSYQFSAINEEIIRYASVNMDCLIFCGAGNDNNERLFYPASYPYAVSVGATNALDFKADFSNYGGRLDLFAPGDLILSTWTNGEYVRSGGTSMSSPLAAGCAAILRSAYPQYSAQQILYQLKTTADRVDLLPGNSAYAGKMGSGRVNLFRSLSEAGQPAVVLIEAALSDLNSELYLPGDTIALSGKFINYLADAENVQITISSPTGNIEVINPFRNIGNLGSLEVNDISENPFYLVISGDVTFNEDATIQIKIESDQTVLYQTIPLRLYADFINIRHNDVHAGIGGAGQIGVVGDQYLKGLGIRLQGEENQLFEGGLMFSPFEGTVVDGVRGNALNNDWEILERFTQLPPFEGSTVKFRSSMQSNLPESPLFVETRLFADSLAEFSKFIVLDYTLNNTSSIDYSAGYLGIFADWDLGDYSQNRSLYNQSLQLHYVFQPGADTLFAGIQTLGNIQGTAYGIENIPGGSGQINMSDGFSEEEKRICLKNLNPEAGMSETGTDVITVTGAGPFVIPSLGQVRTGFALHLARNQTELFQQAVFARNYYQNVVTPLTANQSQNYDINRTIIFPNPTSIFFNIVSENSPEAILITDFSGRLIAEYKVTDAQKTFELPQNIEQGIYLVKVKTQLGWITKKLMIE